MSFMFILFRCTASTRWGLNPVNPSNSDPVIYSTRPRCDRRQPADDVSTCQRCVGQRQLPSVTRVLSAEATKTVVHAFISSRIDYCNSLLFDISDNLLRRFQAVRNAAARLVTGTQRRVHITPVLRQLHWLPVRQRVEFTLTVLVYKALNGLYPVHNIWRMTCQLTTTTGRRRLRPSSVATCEVSRTRTCLGDRSFIVAGPRL